MKLAKKRFFFKNVYESGIIEIWFKGLAYSLATSALIFLYFTEATNLAYLGIISYLFTVIQVVHGSRKPYEYLKDIYVDSNKLTISGVSIYGAFFYIRIQIIFAPIFVIFLAHNSGKLPI